MKTKYLASSAEMSACGRYRHSLTRVWEEVSYHCLFVMLNPSTADGAVDDPTVRKCVGFAKLLGHGAMTVVNLFDYRATDPAELYRANLRRDRLASADWRRHFERAVAGCERVVVAWGAHGKLYDQDLVVTRLLRDLGVEPQCLAVNKDGTPKHPLYVGYNVAPKPYPERSVL